MYLSVGFVTSESGNPSRLAFKEADKKLQMFYFVPSSTTAITTRCYVAPQTPYIGYCLTRALKPVTRKADVC